MHYVIGAIIKNFTKSKEFAGIVSFYVFNTTINGKLVCNSMLSGEVVELLKYLNFLLKVELLSSFITPLSLTGIEDKSKLSNIDVSLIEAFAF